MGNLGNRIEKGKVSRNFKAAEKIYNRVNSAMNGFNKKFDRFSLAVAESFVTPEQAQQQVALNLATINNQMAKLTPQEMEEVAFLMDTTGGQNLNQFKSAGGRKKRKHSHNRKRKNERAYSPNSIRLYLLLTTLLLLLVACQSRPVTETDTIEDNPATLVAEQPTSEAVAAPKASTPESDTDEDQEAELPLTEEEDASPVEPEAENAKYVEAIKNEGFEIVVTPETFNDVFYEVDIDTEEPVYIAFDESNEDDPAYIIVTRDADGEPKASRAQGKRFNPNPEEGTIDFFADDENEAPNAEPTATYNAATATVESTPEAVEVATPTEESTDDDGATEDDVTPDAPDGEESGDDTPEEVDGSKSIELAAEQIGLEVERIGTQSITLHEAVGGDDNVEPTRETSTSEYKLAYDQYGSVIGSWDGEAWISGGQFTAEEIDPDGNVSFTNTTGNSEGGTGTKAIVESRIDIPEGLELLDANGNPTGIFAETLLLASWIGTEGVETGYVVYMEHARNSAGDSEQGAIGSTFQESPLPLWTYTDYEINYAKRFAAGYPLVFVYAGLVPDQSVNWYELSEGELPLLDSGNRVYLNFAANGMNGRGTEAGPMANFLRPITSTYDSLFYTTGNPADAGAGVQRFNGKTLLVVPNGGTTINHTFIPVSSSTSN